MTSKSNRAVDQAAAEGRAQGLDTGWAVSGYLISGMIARNTISSLREQQCISFELHGPPYAADDNQMVAASMLGFRATFKEGRNAVQDRRAIPAFGPGDI